MKRLEPKSSVLVVVDVQERLFAAMPEPTRATLVANVTMLLHAARILGVHPVATEQYPKGLGPTVPVVAEHLAASGASVIDKLHFDACDDDRFADKLRALAPSSVVLVGMEAHVCVFQTARRLVELGYDTWVVADAVASRTEDNRRLGLALAEQAQATVAPAETVAFDWLRQAGTDAFREVSRLLR